LYFFPACLVFLYKKPFSQVDKILVLKIRRFGWKWCEPKGKKKLSAIATVGDLIRKTKGTFRVF
jgi:hypothetical protein